MVPRWQSPVYLERERLLSLLPEEPGFAVLLEAPAGFGKSVLAGQLAARLDLRTLWASAKLGEPRGLLAKALALPERAPWGVVVEALKEEPTLVVLEDLEGDEDLSPLLRTLPALLVLASRTPLPYPELPKLLAEGRLVRLGPEELAFTLEEARALFGERPGAEAAHRATGGWPLPLFLAALTGKPPEAKALIQGLRESLSPEAFREGLLLAALPYLPREAATPATEELFAKGLLRGLPQGYALHPLLQEVARGSLGSEVQRAVQEAEGRLPPELLAQAYHASGLHERLLSLLERPIQLNLLPEALTAWRDLLERGGPRARLRLGEALLQCGKREGLALLKPLAESQDPGVALTASGHLAYYLADPLLGQDLGRARAHLEKGMGLLDQVPPELAGRFLNDAARVPWEEGKLEEALGMLEEALRRLPLESPFRIAPLTNLALLRFELQGDLMGWIQAIEEAIPLSLRYTPVNHAGHLRDLGRLHLLLGERARAEAYLKEAQEAKGHPLASLEAGMLLAHLRGDEEGVKALVARAKLWENPYLVGRGLALLALLRGDARVLEGAEGLFPALARAELQKDPGLLPPYPREREERLYWHAARYRILRGREDLEAILGLTQEGPRLLAGLIPLGLLPRDRPELARAYPLEEVLRSGWKEAVALRLSEVPPLKAEVLGQFRVLGPLGKVALSGKAREVFALLLLGVPREEIAFLLWPEVPEGAALNNLSVWLSRLRKALEPWGVPTYLREEGLCRVESDLQALEAALEEKDAQRALALYQEPLFPSLDLPLLDRKREELYHRVRALFLEAGEARYLERLLELDPLDEEALLPLVNGCLFRGQRARALKLLRAYERRLWEELGERPSGEVAVLLRRLQV
ncbi:AfsR/SARP family transcriptional regulator [Thermus sediminis]|uniref:AfsR/SARP family transcriptional regulator n=1 Tax=Thermus sediminis TaxID=1761908 RepID=UPI000E3E08E1|nr:transcriptional regulator [Thermus sediminis]